MRQPPEVGRALLQDVVHGEGGPEPRDGPDAPLVDAAEQGPDALLPRDATRHADGIAAAGVVVFVVVVGGGVPRSAGRAVLTQDARLDDVGRLRAGGSGNEVASVSDERLAPEREEEAEGKRSALSP